MTALRAGARDRPARIGMLTYSTKPRGGVVHALHLAEALSRRGEDVRLFALGDPAEGFFRPTDAPFTLFPAPGSEGTLEERVFRSVDALVEGLAGPSSDHDLLHVQDCIAARAALELRDSGNPARIVRTVHHIDDFTTPALIECQNRSVTEPDHVLVVSDFWRRVLLKDFGVEADVVPSGVDVSRFHRPSDADERNSLRHGLGAEARFLFLTVGGIEPRKGSLHLMEALARLKQEIAPPPVLVIVGGHSFQDHAPYRDRVLARAADIGLDEGSDVVILGTVPDAELTRWYWAADAFVFPSVKEGFGLVVLEAMAAGLPVIATDIPVFREYLNHEEGAVLARAGDAASLAAAMRRVVEDPGLRERLGAAGPRIASRFTWDASARRHEEIYERVLRDVSPERTRAGT